MRNFRQYLESIPHQFENWGLAVDYLEDDPEKHYDQFVEWFRDWAGLFMHEVEGTASQNSMIDDNELSDAITGPVFMIIHTTHSCLRFRRSIDTMGPVISEQLRAIRENAEEWVENMGMDLPKWWVDLRGRVRNWLRNELQPMLLRIQGIMN
jgi:hypothetical protein